MLNVIYDPKAVRFLEKNLDYRTRSNSFKLEVDRYSYDGQETLLL